MDNKTKNQLINELTEMRQEVAELQVKEIKLKQSGEQILLANERLQYLLSSASAVIYIAKTSGDYGATIVSENVNRMVGYEPQNFIENSSFWLDHVHPEDKQRILAELLQIFKQKYYTYEYRFLCKNGTYIWMRDEMKLILDKKRKPLEIIGYWIDISERKQAEQALKEREKGLEIKTKNLEEANTALKVLLKKRDEDRIEIEERVLLNVKERVIPYLEKLKKSRLDEKQKLCVSILESNLNDIVSPFSQRLSSEYLDLTPTEIQVANLLRQGKTNKEISELLNSSPRTVAFHRENIRKKLGLKNKKTNLRTHLLSLT